MSISRDQFSREMDTNINKILQFLARHMDQAFTDQEIGEGLKIEPKKLLLALIDLKAMGVVAGKTIGQSHYYALSDDLAEKIKNSGLSPDEIIHELERQGAYQPEEDATRYIG